MELDADLVLENAAEDYAALVKENWILRAKVALLGAAIREQGDTIPDEPDEEVLDDET